MLIYLLLVIFGIHVALANLGIGLSTAIPLLKRRAEVEGGEVLGKVKRLMRFYASTYGLAGVMGTAFTVFLLSFYPDFIGFAGKIAFVPFALSILLIALHFLCIVLYWYGWDRFDSSTHFAIGIVMAISAILIPLGFRAIFGFLNVPMGLEFQPKLHLDTLKALTNPTFLALYPKSILASFAVTLSLLAWAFWDFKISEDFAKLSLVFLTATCFFGVVYAETLGVLAPSKFENAVHSPMLYAKLIFVAVQFVALTLFLRGWRNAVIPATACGFAGVFLGESLNALSQYPNLIANPSILPSSVRPSIAPILNLAKPNPLTQIPGLYTITLAFLIPLLLASLVLIYYAVEG